MTARKVLKARKQQKTDGQKIMNLMNEYITAEAAKFLYGIGFGELMSAADSEVISRREDQGPNGHVTYTFLRADIINYQERKHGND